MEKEIVKTKLIYKYLKDNNKSLAKKYKKRSNILIQHNNARSLRKNNRKIMKELVGGMMIPNAMQIFKIKKYLKDELKKNKITINTEENAKFETVISSLEKNQMTELVARIKSANKPSLNDLQSILLPKTTYESAAEFKKKLIEADPKILKRDNPEAEEQDSALESSPESSPKTSTAATTPSTAATTPSTAPETLSTAIVEDLSQSFKENIIVPRQETFGPDKKDLENYFEEKFGFKINTSIGGAANRSSSGKTSLEREAAMRLATAGMIDSEGSSIYRNFIVFLSTIIPDFNSKPILMQGGFAYYICENIPDDFESYKKYLEQQFNVKFK